MKPTRSELIERLSDFSGPLDAGVFTGYEHCLDDMMARWLDTDELVQAEQEKNQWLSQLDMESTLSLFIELLVKPPPETTDREFRKGWEGNLSDYLVRLCRRDPAYCLKHLGPLLEAQPLRAFLMHVMGQLGHPIGLKWLEPYVGKQNLTENEWLTLAKSIQDIGGREAYRLLTRLRHALADATPELQLMLVRIL